MYDSIFNAKEATSETKRRENGVKTNASRNSACTAYSLSPAAVISALLLSIVKIINETQNYSKKNSETDNPPTVIQLSTPPLQKMVKAQSTSITLTPLFCVCSLHPLPLVCYGGGGGSSKSGIKNCIVIETCRWDDPNVSAKVTSVETGDDICTSINAFAVKAERPSAKAVVMCAVIGSSVAAYRLEYYREDDDDDDLKEEHGFKLDLQKVGACQIDTAKHGIVECAGAMGNENGDGGRVAIATETGRLLIYNVGYDAEKKSPLTIILAHVDDKRHSSAICGVFMGRGAGTGPWVATGGKGGCGPGNPELQHSGNTQFQHPANP